MKLFKINSIRTKLFLFVSFIVSIVILSIACTSYNFLSNQIKSQKIKEVGKVAKDRHNMLIEHLNNNNQNAQNLLNNIITFCAEEDLKTDIRSGFTKDLKEHFNSDFKKHFNKNCVLSLLQMPLYLEKAYGVLFRQTHIKTSWSVGKIDSLNINQQSFMPNQLAIFKKRGRENIARTYYFLAFNSKLGLELLIEYPLDLIQKIFRPLNDLGTTGETFLTDRDGYFITKMRYQSNQGIQEPISTHPMQSCLRKNSNEILELDYRDAPIIHGYRYIPEIGGGCIMAHIEQKEAFLPINKMLKQISLVAILLILLSLPLIFIFANYFSKPLIYLSNLAMSIANGGHHLKSELKRNDEIGTLSNAFNKMTKKLIDSVEDRRAKLEAENENKHKTSFLASMSHEIRTPLHSIIGITELLQDSDLDNEQKNLLSVAHNAEKNLLSVINDSLDMSKIESGEFNIESIPFLLTEQIKSCVSIVEVSAKVKNLKIIWEVENDINDQRLGDPTRLRQILINLLNNAVKFSKNGIISVHVKKSNENKLLFTVADQGVGIPEEKQKVIFESYKQADDSVTRKFGGTGLGLAITKKIVELMNGNIWLESTLNIGSTFYFNLHLPETDQLSSEVKNIDTKLNINKVPLKILVADDNEVNLLIFELFLKEIHNLTFAKNGQEAFELFKKDSFDLVFLDVGMPIWDGYHSTIEIRRWEVENQIKPSVIIACTANAFESDIQESHKAGCNDHLIKPFTKEKLLEMINHYTIQKN